MDRYDISSRVQAIGIISIKDETTRKEVIEWLWSIGVAAIVLSEKSELELPNIIYTKRLASSYIAGLDFFIYDGKTKDINVLECIRHGVVPILPEKNNFSSLLTAFNPLKFCGNAFMYKKENTYTIFSKVVSFLENNRFPEDRKVLVKNVCGTY